MKNILIKILPLCLICLLNLVSCSMGLDDLPAFSESEIIKFEFEKRYVEQVDVTITVGGQTTTVKEDRVKFVGGQTNSVQIDKEAKEIRVIFKADAPITAIVGMATISPGATISPLEGAPTLGKVGSFEGTRKYRVVSANKENTTLWTVISSVQP